MLSSSCNPLLRSKHAFAPWINFLLLVELTSRVIQSIEDSSQIGLRTTRSVVWGMLCAKVAIHLLCRYQVLWWTLDYYGKGVELAALSYFPESYWSPVHDRYSVYCADSRSRIESSWRFAMMTFYSVIEFLSIRCFSRSFADREEAEPLVPPSAQWMDREVELTESRHDKHA